MQCDPLVPTAWFYKGQSFAVGYFDSAEKSDIPCVDSKLFGQPVSIAVDALEKLSGQTLSLRRVKSSYGIFPSARNVLVATPASEMPQSRQEEPSLKKRWWIFLGLPASVIGGSILILNHFVHSDEAIACGSVVVVMLAFGISLYLCGRMPRRFVFVGGALGWTLTAVLALWFVKVHGP